MTEDEARNLVKDYARDLYKQGYSWDEVQSILQVLIDDANMQLAKESN